MVVSLVAAKDDEGRRLDRVIRKLFPLMPASALYRILRKGGFRINGVPGKGAVRLHAGDKIQFDNKEDAALVFVPAVEIVSSTELPAPEILFENNDIIALNKPSGLVVHGKDSLETSVRNYLADKLAPSLSFKSGPLHRLDRETSGLVFFSKSLAGATWFSSALHDGLLRKNYLALLQGELHQYTTWTEYLVRRSKQKKSITCTADTQGAKLARTNITPLYTQKGVTFAIVEILTGRTHQIRTCAAAHGYPLYGDSKYGGKSGRFFLHSHSITFPADNPMGLPVTITAPPPAGFITDITQIISEGEELPMYFKNQW